MIAPSIGQEEGVDGQQGQQEARRLPGKASQTICRTRPERAGSDGEFAPRRARVIGDSLRCRERFPTQSGRAFQSNLHFHKCCTFQKLPSVPDSVLEALPISPEVPADTQSCRGRSELRSASRRSSPGPHARSGAPDFLPLWGGRKADRPMGSCRRSPAPKEPIGHRTTPRRVPLGKTPKSGPASPLGRPSRRSPATLVARINGAVPGRTNRRPVGNPQVLTARVAAGGTRSSVVAYPLRVLGLALAFDAPVGVLGWGSSGGCDLQP